MRVAEFVPDRSEALYNGLTTTEDTLENILGMLIGSKIKALRRRPVEARQLIFFAVGCTSSFNDMFAYRLKQRASQGDGAFRITLSALYCALPNGMNTRLIERYERLRDNAVCGLVLCCTLERFG